MSTFQLKEGRRRASSTPTIPPNTIYLDYFNFFTHFPPHPIPAPGFWKTPIFTLLLWVLIYKWDHIIFIFPKKKKILSFPVASRPISVVTNHSFLFMTEQHFIVYAYTTFFSSSHLLMETQVASVSWLL